METDVENECTGEILYATSYGLNIGRTLYHTSLNKVTDAWIESVKVQKRVVCENTAWADFELTTDIVLEHNDKPEIVAMRRFCYKSFCQNISSFFGITSIYQFLNKIFKRNYVLNSTDIIYKMFIDSMLYDVRFIVCVRLPRIAINLNKEYLDETENQTIDNSNNRSVILSPDDILTNLANDNLTSKLKSNNKLYVDNESIYSASDDGILSRYENEINNISRPNKLLVKNTSDRNIKNFYVDVGDSYSDIFDNYNDFSESEEGSLNNEFVKGNVDSDGNVINKLAIIPNNDRSARNDLNNIQANTGPTSLSATTAATTNNVTTTTTTNNNNNINTTTKTTDFASTATTATVSENFNNGVLSKTSVVTTDVAKYENEKIEKEKTKSYYSLSFLNDEDDRENNVVITEQVEEENQSGQVGPSVNVIPPSSRINEKVVIKRRIVEESENIENGDNNFQYDDGEQITYEIDGPWLSKRRKKSSKIQINEIENNVEIQENFLNDYDDDSNVEIEELKVEKPAPSSSSLPQQSQPQQQQEQFNNSNVEIEQIVQDGGVEQLTAADGGDGSDDIIYSKAEELLNQESVSRGGGDGSVRIDVDEEIKLDQFLIKSQNRKRRIREGEFEENIDAENLPKSAKYRLVAAKEKLKNQFVKRRLIKSNNSGNRNMQDDDKENVNIIFARPVEEEMQLAKPLEDYNNDIREDEDNIIISEEIMESKQIHPTTPNMSNTPPLSLIKSRKRRIVREQNEEEYEPFSPPAKIRKVDDDYVRRQSRHEPPPPPTLLSDNNVVDSYNEEEEYYANLASGGVNNVQRQSLSSTNRTRVETFSTPTSEMNFEIQNTTSGSKKSKQKNIIKLPELLFVGLDDKRRRVESEQIMTNLDEEKMSYVLFKGIIINKSMDDTDLQTLARNNIVLFYTINRKLDGSAVMKLFKILNNTRNDDNYYLELHENIIDDIIHKLFGQRSDKSNFNIRRFTVDKANLNITMDNVLHLLFKRLDVSTPSRGSIRV